MATQIAIDGLEIFFGAFEAAASERRAGTRIPGFIGRGASFPADQALGVSISEPRRRIRASTFFWPVAPSPACGQPRASRVEYAVVAI